MRRRGYAFVPLAEARRHRRLAADVVRIDGSGRWLIPGLAEMHAHVPPGDAPAETVEDMLFLYLANGVRTIRGMLGARTSWPCVIVSRVASCWARASWSVPRR